VHEQQLDVLGVVDEESLVAGGHHVLGLLVATVTDLVQRYQYASSSNVDRSVILNLSRRDDRI
jgi:hypothetical protein